MVLLSSLIIAFLIGMLGLLGGAAIIVVPCAACVVVSVFLGIFKDQTVRMQAIVELKAEAVPAFEITATFTVIQYQACDLFVQGCVRLVRCKLLALRESWHI